MNKDKKRKAIIDDGMNPELVKGADFDGYLGIPMLKKSDELIIPTGIVPFTYRNSVDDNLASIGFYEMDTDFADILVHPEEYVDELKGRIVITPDCSLYRDMPLAAQITNVYRNRAIGVFLQKNGVYVIPQIRWGNSLTYTTEVLPEKVAFLGVPKHSILAIGNYGCFKSREDKEQFRAGLTAMLETLEPEIVLVYGSLNPKFFTPFMNKTQFIHFTDWLSLVKGGER